MNAAARSGNPFPLREREFVAMMALTQALHALAIDAMLPALGQMALDLNAVDENQRQFVVGIFLFGLGFGSLLPGPLADRFGRRAMLLVCLGFYIVPMVACALVRDFNTLLVLRLVQALGCSGLAVLPATIIRDRFEGDQMARLQSLVTVVFMAVPMLAPLLGQGIMVQFGWRWIFGAMAVMGIAMAIWVWMRLPETLAPENRHNVRLESIALNMAKIVTTRESVGYVFASALMMGSIWGYINSSQQLIAEGLGAGAMFPFVFGVVVAGMAVANFVNARIVSRFGARRVSHCGIFAFIAAAGLQVWLAHSGQQTLWQFASVMSINMALVGFMGANFSAIALQPFGRAAGVASSVQAFIRLVGAAVIGAFIGQAYDGTARPLALALLACGCIVLLLVLFSERGKLFRRVSQPGTVPDPDMIVR